MARQRSVKIIRLPNHLFFTKVIIPSAWIRNKIDEIQQKATSNFRQPKKINVIKEQLDVLQTDGKFFPAVLQTDGKFFPAHFCGICRRQCHYELKTVF